MATLPIFPSLTRAPSMDSSEQVEDDTIRDQMDNGYVATRPRFTRARRSWNCNIRNLVPEDVRAVRNFRDVIAQRGSLPFRYPNLISNGSFEMPAGPQSSSIAQGWASDGGQVAASISTVGYDGYSSMQLQATSALTGGIQHSEQFPCNVGDLFCVAAMASVVAASSGAGNSMQVQFMVTYDDATQTNITATAPLPAVGAGWQLVGTTLTIPPGASGSLKGLASLTLQISSAAAIVVLLDSVGVALSTAGRGAAQMIGSEPIAAPVRFASSGLPKFSDLGWIGGGKRYGATFMLEEV